MDKILCAIGAFFFRFRNGLFPVIYLLVALFVRPAFFAGNPKWDPFATGIGLIVAMLGETIRCLTIGLVYSIVRGGRDGRVYADHLVTEGIYAHTRNPMYVGNLLFALGFCLMYGSPWMYLVVFPFFLLVYVSIVFEEERFLSEKFGEKYDKYVHNTNRFLPRLQGLVQTIRQHHFDWTRVIAKEYGTLFVFLRCLRSSDSQIPLPDRPGRHTRPPWPLGSIFNSFFYLIWHCSLSEENRSHIGFPEIEETKHSCLQRKITNASWGQSTSCTSLAGRDL